MLDHLLGSTKLRRLTKNGVNLYGIFYRDQRNTFELLNDYAGIQKAGDRLKATAAAWVKVRFNEDDLSEVQIWNERKGHWLPVPSSQPRYTEDLTLFQHKQIKAWAKKQSLAFASEEQQLAARHKLNQLIQKLVPQLALRDRAAMARMAQSNRINAYDGGGDYNIIEVESSAAAVGETVEMEPGTNIRESGLMPPRPKKKPQPKQVETPLDDAIDNAGRTPDDDWDDLDINFDGEEFGE